MNNNRSVIASLFLLTLAACQPEESSRAWQRVGDGCAYLPKVTAMVPCQE